MNQTPEEIARDKIDKLLESSGWIIQNKKHIDLSAGNGVAVREYYTDIGPADYILFVDRKPVGVIEAKKEDEGVRLTTVEEQSTEYAQSNRDKTSLDIFWLRDKSLADLDNLPDPDELAGDIVENLEAAVESFKEVAQRI